MANFIDLVKELAHCNEIPMKPNEDFDFTDLDIPVLNAQAEKLGADEISIFVDGNAELAARIVSKHKIELLDKTLDRLHSGDLYYNFYED